MVNNFLYRWFYTSDLLVREASLEEVRKANAYMILYEKVTWIEDVCVCDYFISVCG